MPRYLVAINLHDNCVPFVEGLLSVSCKSREEVDGFVAKAIAGAARPTTSRRITASCIPTALST